MKKWLFLCFTASAWCQQPAVDFLSVKAHIDLDFEQKSIQVKADYSYKIHAKTDSIFIDAQQISVAELSVNGKKTAFKNDGKRLGWANTFKSGTHELSIRYRTIPKQTLYFMKAGDHEQIWTQGQGKYTSHWLPSFDDVNEKMTFALSVAYAPDYTVVSNGALVKKTREGEKVRWHYRMEKPMSSYLAMLAIGDFEKRDLVSQGGVLQELYISPPDREKWEPTYRYSTQMFDFLERETGVAYPWGIYRQVPVHDFLYGGMENTTATLFTREYVVDSIGFNDRNYVYVNAHELAHQWFGNLVTAKSSTHHWLQEGFATYFAWQAERHVLGENHYYWKLYRTAETLLQASKTDTIPVMNAKASSLSFYEKGGWALASLRHDLGDEAFLKAVKNYLNKYAFKSATTDDFLAEVRAVSNLDTNTFKSQWLLSGEFPIEKAFEVLRKSPMLETYFSVGERESDTFDEKRDLFERLLKSDVFFPIKQEIVYQLAPLPWAEKKALMDLAMASDLKTRQAVAVSVNPLEYEPYDALLKDASYFTQEIALNALCKAFPSNRAVYLDKMDGVMGLNDKNIRMLWLTLALQTPNYRQEQKPAYYNELLSYAAVTEEAVVRQAALEKLLHLTPGDTNALALLPQTLVHHKWQLTKFGRDTIRKLLKNPSYRTFFESVMGSISAQEQQQLQRLLNE